MVCYIDPSFIRVGSLTEIDDRPKSCLTNVIPFLGFVGTAPVVDPRAISLRMDGIEA